MSFGLHDVVFLSHGNIDGYGEVVVVYAKDNSVGVRLDTDKQLYIVPESKCKLVETKLERFQKQGLIQRYHITKANGKPVDPSAEYFVMRIDNGGGDPIHIKACRAATVLYANMVADHLPQLSKDLIARCNQLKDEARK